MLLSVLAVALILIGLAGIVLPALPGTALIFAGLLLAAWADDFMRVGAATLVVLGLLTVASYGIDFAAAALGAGRFGASRRAMAGAALGTALGLVLGLPGLILGPFIGAVLGELSTTRDLARAAGIGVGAWIGFVIGVAVKVGVAFLMIAIFLAAFFLF
ncbi:MAG: DUF456 domain-containing protein [Acidobacteria bacterium]|nr:DUF456 domain-containing protein [Acidobacteriota bacterium]